MKEYYLFCFLIGWLPSSAPVNAQNLDQKEVLTLQKQITDLIEEHYVIKEKTKNIVNKFEKKVASGRYHEIAKPDSLAKQLTEDLRKISNDKHLYVQHVDNNGSVSGINGDLWEKKERILEEKKNYGFTKIQILDGNIGYVRIVEFMHPQRGMQTAVAAMKFVEQTKGLIIDIRGNGGGYGGLMNYILNHYFEGGPTHISTTIYSEKNKYPDKEYTSDLVYGKLRADTPLYIITDKQTGSAAEFFAYTLQSFGKAKIVGQSTAGAAHLNSYFPLKYNFRISISTAAPINPITKTNWENVGVIPDVHIESPDIVQKTVDLIKREL